MPAPAGPAGRTALAVGDPHLVLPRPRPRRRQRERPCVGAKRHAADPGEPGAPRHPRSDPPRRGRGRSSARRSPPATSCGPSRPPTGCPPPTAARPVGRHAAAAAPGTSVSKLGRGSAARTVRGRRAADRHPPLPRRRRPLARACRDQRTSTSSTTPRACAASGIGGLHERARDAPGDTEVGKFGWAAPPKRPPAQGSGRALPGAYRAPGAAALRVRHRHAHGGRQPAHARGTTATPTASCMVLNQNFGPFPGTPLNAMRATVAHEFNHSLQFGYGALTAPTKVKAVWVEGGATWMEDEVFDRLQRQLQLPVARPAEAHAAVRPRLPLPVLGGLPRHDRAVGGTGRRARRPADLPRLLGAAQQECLHEHRRVQRRAFQSVRVHRSPRPTTTPASPCGSCSPCGAQPPEPYCLEEAAAYTSKARRPPRSRDSVKDAVGTTLVHTRERFRHPVDRACREHRALSRHVKVMGGRDACASSIVCRTVATLTVTGARHGDGTHPQ